MQIITGKIAGNHKIKEKPKKDQIISTDITGQVNQELTVDPNYKVSDLKNAVKEIFHLDIELKTKAGNIAGDSRKIKALASKTFEKFAAKNINEITAKTGIQIEFSGGEKNENKVSPEKNIQVNETSAKIEINKSMKVKDVVEQFEKYFGKKVFILSEKGNKVSENRRIQAVSKVKIDQEFFVIEKLTKSNLKIIKKEIGLHIDY